MKQFLFAAGIMSLIISEAQTTDTIVPMMDNTLYEDANGSLSNGSGPFFFAGVTNQGELRRGLLFFDIASTIPAASTIDSVEIEIWSEKRRSGTASFSLHRVSQMWGEGLSATTGNHGQGAPAVTADATWTEAILGGFNPSPWNNLGGDFVSTISASQSISVDKRSYSFKNAQLTADAQNMLSNPTNNFGWLLKSDDENSNGSARSFNTKENNNSGNTHAPRLIVHYTLNSVGIEAEDLKSFEIYPNPGSERLMIKRNFSSEVKVDLMDLTGRTVLSTSISGLSNELNTSALPKGVYILRIQDYSGELNTQRWVKS